MAIKRATACITLFDMNDVISSPTKPSNPIEGTMWFNTADGKLYIYTNGDWKFAADGVVIGGRNLIVKTKISYSNLTSIDESQFKNKGEITATTSNTYGGIAFQFAELKPNTQYVLHYKIKKVTGNLTKIGGHLDPTFTGRTRYVIDSKEYDVPYSSPPTLATLDDGNWHYVEYYFKTSATVDPNHKMYIQPNRGDAATIRFTVSEMMMEEGNMRGSWQPSPEDTQGQIDDIKDSVESLGEDGKITRFERSLVRGYIADITGKYLTPTDAMPPLTDIDKDTYSLGKLYAIRRTARKIGLNIASSANYKPMGDAYTALVTYLTGLTPVKPWDTSSSAIINIDRNVWNAKWNDYYNRYALFEIEVQDRQKEYTEQETQKMKDETIAAISTPGNHERKTYANPVIITPPIATLGLPEFEGFHTDSWEWNGRNYILKSDTGYSWTGSLGQAGFSTKTFSPLALTVFDKKQITMYIEYKLTDIVYGTTNPWIGMQIGVAYTDGTSEYPTCLGGKLGGTSTNGFVKQANTYQFNPAKTIKALTLMLGGRDLTGTVEIQNYKIEIGSKTKDQVVWTPAIEDVWAGVGNRIRPVTNPLFSSGTDLTIWGKFYGDGTNNDKFYWDTNGAAIKEKKWMDVRLDAKQNWSFSTTATGMKRVRADGFAYSNSDSNSLTVVKSDGKLIAKDENLAMDTYSTSSTLDKLWLSIDNNDSGWGGAYTPVKEDITAYFLGWRMCDGTFGGQYPGTGTKQWYPVGDKDLSRATVVGNAAPTEPSPSISDKSTNYYQVIYRLVDPIQETVEFDGILELLASDNVVTSYFPTWAPPITKGSIKYGINLATVSQDTRYIIPSLVKRISTAEQKITDDSITNTVFSSREYTLALKNKANASDLGNLATKDELNNVSGGVDGKIKDAMDKLDFSPYATKSELKQTATDITAKFSATGGMNLIKNSIGYSDLDFWTLINAYKVDTISNASLDNLGFGKGFYFRANGQQQGITQDIPVIPGQPYTLGWYLNKMTKGDDTSYRFWIQVQEYDGTQWITPPQNQIADNSKETTNGFEARYMTFTPTRDKVRVRFIGYANVEAILSGIMLNIGDVALQWTLATGELYNTNIRMNINGIRVSQLDSNGSEIGFTQITPSEFAGYYQNNGTFEKVFYLNGDETVTKKLRATNEITLGNIKILSIQSANSTGWAFVSNKL